MKIFKLNTNEFGLKVLSGIKKLKGDAVDLSNLYPNNAPKIDHDLWTDILQRNVDKRGNVDYKGFQREEAQLDQYLGVLSKNPPGMNWTEEEQLAYWINVYNAFTVKLILNHYPLNSIKDISDGLPMINSPWDIKFFKIGTLPMDLNTVEHQILRKQFEEPRIHFAINCASISCPRLREEAFVAEQLELQLEDQTQDFIHDISKNIINESTTELSSIFNWFQGDFTKEGTLLEFIGRYNPELKQTNDIQYLEYDWGLNDLKH